MDRQVQNRKLVFSLGIFMFLFAVALIALELWTHEVSGRLWRDTIAVILCVLILFGGLGSLLLWSSRKF